MARKNDILSIYTKEVEQIKADGLFKGEAPFVSPQGAKVVMEDGRELLNMCANNYLGLGDNQRLIDAAKKTYDEKGYGVASVRFICGTQDIHKKLEKKISGFLGTDDTILYSSCFDANGGLFETILTAEDAVISDELNHASIIDGVRLCKAKRYRYKNNNMEDLEAQLQAADAAGARVKLIATDGVFSMDGIICNLKARNTVAILEAFAAFFTGHQKKLFHGFFSFDFSIPERPAGCKPHNACYCSTQGKSLLLPFWPKICFVFLCGCGTKGLDKIIRTGYIPVPAFSFLPLTLCRGSCLGV